MTEHTMNVFVGLIGDLPLREGETVIGTRELTMSATGSFESKPRDDEFMVLTSAGRLLWVHHDSYFGENHMRRANGLPMEGNIDRFKHERANKFQGDATLSQALSHALVTERLEARLRERQARSAEQGAIATSPSADPTPCRHAYYLIQSKKHPLPKWAEWNGVSLRSRQPAGWTAADPDGAWVKIYRSVKDFLAAPLTCPEAMEGDGSHDVNVLKAADAALHAQLVMAHEQLRKTAKELSGTPHEDVEKLERINRRLIFLGGAVKGLEYLIQGPEQEDSPAGQAA